MGSQIIRQRAVDEGLEDMFGGVKLIFRLAMEPGITGGKEMY